MKVANCPDLSGLETGAMNPCLTPDLNEARRFIELLTCGGGTPITFQTFDDRKPARPELVRVLHGPFAEHVETLIDLNRRGAGVFLLINEGDGVIHPGNKTCRTKANVRRIRALFVDLDGAPLEPILAAEAKPNLIVESSPGRWHSYWLVEDLPLEDFKACQRALANKFAGDPSVCDLSRVMRLPGFLHQKASPFLVRIHSVNGS